MLAVAALAAFAIGLCLNYGRLGINPLDQSIVFDGGWRILSGQLPFRDFTTPLGIVPSAMQALFFAAFGVSWFTYCLHAAIVNALFAIVALVIARRLGAGFWTAWFVGVGSAIVFYTPFSVPFSDQHSFFFSACCVWTTLESAGNGARARRALLATPSLAALALLSKLIPAGFVVVPCVLVASARSLRNDPWWLVAGLALPVAVGVAAVAAIHAPIHDLIYFMFTLPAQVGAHRTVDYVVEGTLFGARVEHIWLEWVDLLPISRALVAGLWLATIAAWVAPRGVSHPVDRSASARLLGFSLWLALVTAAFTYVTNNAASNGLAFLPLIVVSAWLAFSRAFEGFASREFGHRRTVHVVLAVLVFAASASDLWRFNQNVNAEHGHTMFDRSLPRWSPGGRLGFLRLNDKSYAFDVRDILPYIASRPDNFLLIGDSAFLYGATGHPSVFPALWFHYGLTTPAPGSDEFPAFDARVLSNVMKYDARYIIQEGDRAPMGGALNDFTQLFARVDGCPQRAVGAWTIREICH